MMKWLHHIVQVLIVALLLATGAGLVSAAASAERWEASRTAVRVNRLTAAAAGVGLVCLTAMYVLTGLRPRKRERFLSFEQEGGTVRMSTAAIEDYVAKLASEFPSVVRMQPRVVPLRRSVDIRVDLRVKASPQIHEVCDLLQRRIRESVTNGLGISEIRRVVVSVRDVVSEHRPQ